jgi:pyruvate/2-oxoglutarate dehydrogenase complex dihydrolipoamide dehydrogenase (E3) component
MESLLPAETVVLALGASPLNHLFNTLKDKIPEIYAVGDCVKPRTILEAVREAYDVAKNI